jgi:serine/threonine protein kinase
MPDLTGKQLGNYQLTHLLVQDEFAEIYAGEHCNTRNRAAIKILQTVLSQQEQQEFLDEVQTLVQLEHPHLVRVLDFGMEESTLPYIVLEYLTGESLRKRHSRGILPLTTILSYVRQIASALHYLHEKKLIHGNLKPGNMLLSADGKVILSDFSLSMLAHRLRSLTDQKVTESAYYRAPEQIQGKVCAASDQYALGMVVYEWLCGMRPFGGTTPVDVVVQHLSEAPPRLRDRMPSLAPAIEQVVLKALEKEPQRRFATILDFANSLEGAYTNVYSVAQKRLDGIARKTIDLSLSAVHREVASSELQEEAKERITQKLPEPEPQGAGSIPLSSSGESQAALIDVLPPPAPVDDHKQPEEISSTLSEQKAEEEEREQPTAPPGQKRWLIGGILITLLQRWHCKGPGWWAKDRGHKKRVDGVSL